MTDLPACRELKPCPFCGSHNVDWHYPEHAFDEYKVICESCSAKGPMPGDLDPSIAAWNIRTHEGGEAVASDNLMIRNPCPNAAPAVSPSKTVTVQLGQPYQWPHPKPLTPSVDVETLKALVERWRTCNIDEYGEYREGFYDARHADADELEAAIKRGEPPT